MLAWRSPSPAWGLGPAQYSLGTVQFLIAPNPPTRKATTQVNPFRVGPTPNSCSASKT